MAPYLQALIQLLHRVQAERSMTAGCFFSQRTACAGHALKQSPHFLHASSFTLNLISAGHMSAGQRFSWMWASYSFLKYLMVERTGLGAVWPSPQWEVF